VRETQNYSRSKLQKQLQIYLLTLLQNMPVGQCCQQLCSILADYYFTHEYEWIFFRDLSLFRAT
jgi:hypothetical protein